MFPLRSSVIAFVALLSAAAAASAQEKPDRLTDEDRKLFSWFDQLGIEDFSHAKLVRVRVGGYLGPGMVGEESGFDEPLGFLLSEKDGQFHVLLGDLTPMTLKRNETDPKSKDYVDWHPVSLEDEAAALLHCLPNYNDGQPYCDGHIYAMDLLTFRSQAFILARFCLAQQREDLAARLMHAVDHLIRQDVLPLSFLEENLQDDLGQALFTSATFALADAHSDRRRLASLFQIVADRCPHYQGRPNPAKLAATLRKMADEDDTHPKISESDFARLSPADQVRELIFQLRNEYVGSDEAVEAIPWTRPWSFDPPAGNGAVRKLAALGFSAVPALLEALGDDRPTRTIYRVVNTAPASALTTDIRDLASQTLAEISGVDFQWMAIVPQPLPPLPPPNGGGPPTLLDAPIIGDTWPKTQALARDWWNTVQQKGEVVWFRKEIEAGEPGATSCIEALAARHPDALPDLLPALIPIAPAPDQRVAMMKLLTPTNTEKVNAFLVEQMANDPTRIGRVAAAYVLRRHHQPEALAAMLNEFEAIKPALAEPESKEPSAPDATSVNPYAPNAPDHVLAFLLSSNSPVAVQEVRSILPRCSMHTQWGIIGYCSGQLGGLAEGPVDPAGPATRRAVESLLVSELQNEAVCVEGYPNEGPRSRIADIAAQELAEFWPSKYKFNPSAPLGVRTVQIAIMRTKFESMQKRAITPENGEAGPTQNRE